MKEDSTLKFDCVKEEIKKEMERLLADGYKKSVMTGVHKDLVRLKDKFEQFYDEAVYDQGWILSDAPYFGWDAKSLKDMDRLTSEIKKKAIEMYALILIGLGKGGA